MALLLRLRFLLWLAVAAAATQVPTKPAVAVVAVRLCIEQHLLCRGQSKSLWVPVARVEPVPLHQQPLPLATTLFLARSLRLAAVLAATVFQYHRQEAVPAAEVGEDNRGTPQLHRMELEKQVVLR